MAWNDAQKETIEMVAISSVVPLIPNINVGENEKLSFHTVSLARWSKTPSHMLPTVSTVSFLDIFESRPKTVETVPETKEPTLATGLKPRCE